MDVPGEPQELADGHVLGKSAGAAVLGLGGLVLALVIVVVRPRSRGDVGHALLVLVVAATEMPGLVERCHLGPVVLGDMLALLPVALALPDAAVAGRGVLRPLPGLRKYSSAEVSDPSEMPWFAGKLIF